MGKKKIIIIISLIVVSIITATVAVILAIGGKKSKKISNDEYVTASQWIEILADHTGCEDIALPAGYTADSIADAKLISITAMKTVSAHKYERILGDISNYTDDDYYKLAKDYGLLKEEKKKYNLDECDEILARYNEIYINELWLDDYSKVEYADNVKDLGETLPTQVNEDYSIASFDASQNISQGDVIVFANDKGSKVIRKVDSVDETGAYHLTQPDISEAVTSIDVCDKVEIGFEDIISLDAVEGELVSRKIVSENNYASGESEAFSYDTTDNGFTVTLSVEDNISGKKCLGIEMEEHSTGNTAKWTTSIPLSDGASGELSIDCSNIKIATDTTYFNFEDENEKYAEYTLDMDTTISGGLSFEADVFKIPLFHFNVPFEAGFVNIDFDVYLEMSAEGEFKLSATFPTRVCVRQEKNNGLKLIKGTGLTAEPSVDTEISGEVMLDVAFGAKLNIFWVWDIIGAEIKAGAIASVDYIVRDNGMKCTDFNVAFPVVKLDVYFNGLIEVAEAEFYIVSPDDAPYRWNEHYEEVPGIRPYGKVDECSYGNDELFETYNAEAKPDTAAGDELSVIFGYGLYSRFDVNIIDSQKLSDSGGGADGDVEIWGYTYDITDNGSGYILTGTLSVPNCIPSGKLHDYIDAGKFTHLGREYTVVSTEASVGARTDYTLLGDDGITYWTGSNWIIGDGVGGSCYEMVADVDGDGIPEERKPVVIENASVFVPYGSTFENDFKFCCEHPLTSDPMPHNFAVRFDEQGNMIDIVGSWTLGNNGWYQ